MSEVTEKNVPKGVREGLPKRPAMEEDAWEQIRREQEKMKQREYVRFSVFKVDPAWRRLDSDTREAHKDEFESLPPRQGDDALRLCAGGHPG